MFVIYFLASEVAPLGECRQGRRYFWILPDVCGLRPCAQSHFKTALCGTCPVVGWRTNKVLAILTNNIHPLTHPCTINPFSLYVMTRVITITYPSKITIEATRIRTLDITKNIMMSSLVFFISMHQWEKLIPALCINILGIQKMIISLR